MRFLKKTHSLSAAAFLFWRKENALCYHTGGKSHEKPVSGLLKNPPVFLPDVMAKHFYYVAVKKKKMHADHYMLSLVSLHKGEVIFRAERKRERERDEEGKGGKGRDRDRERDREKENMKQQHLVLIFLSTCPLPSLWDLLPSVQCWPHHAPLPKPVPLLCCSFLHMLPNEKRSRTQTLSQLHFFLRTFLLYAFTWQIIVLWEVSLK